MKAAALKNGQWFVCAVDYEEWYEVRFKPDPALKCLGNRAKRFSGENFYVVGIFEYESQAQLVARMYAALPHDDENQISHGGAGWAWGRKVGRGVALTGIEIRCYSKFGKVCGGCDEISLLIADYALAQSVKGGAS